MKELEKNQCHKIKDINNKMSEIMNARIDCDTNAANNKPLPPPQLSNIATSLINYIDSYLDNNINFQRTCRQIYIASKSPQHIHKISSYSIEKYINYCNKNNKIIDVNKFNRVTGLCFNEKALKLWNDNGFVASNVRKLEFRGFYNEQLENGINELNRLISLNKITLHSVNELVLAEGHFSMSHIIGQMPNLMYLELDTITVDQLTEQCKRIVQSLKVIKILLLSEDDALKIINWCGHQLESLQIDTHLPETFEKFVNIKELSIELWNDTELVEAISMIKKFVKLQTIGLDIHCGNDHCSRHEIFKFLNVLFQIDSLETVRFNGIGASQWTVMCKIIQEALMTTEKNKLNISLQTYCIDINEYIHINCLSLVNALNAAVQNDFMFHLKITKYADINETTNNNMKKWLDKCKQKFHVEYDINKNKVCFILCNKQSKINGYNEITMDYFDDFSIF